VQKSFRNIQRITVMPAAAVGVADVLSHRSLVVTQGAIEVLETRVGDVKRGGKAEESTQEGDS